ncbi:tail sheath stabilizer [Synechococcus phage S-H9-1]|uniref:Tail sheath stabiliser n=1 Tax=Synechococcus phage S-H9-1 TaxID=2783674 RepID=A0A873WE15_9CAUD|nr:tail sheath stabilizer [Synechococcus phage S-H9-1]QPB08248.1 tail sheath stabiliser [Synechococcus phage S-H9-1]
MLGNHFYNQIVRKNIIAFGTLFNNITMKSTDPDTGEVLEEQKVPLAYGPKQKFLVRLTDTSTSKVSITLPRIYFEMTSVEYDSTRKTSPIQKYKTVIDDNGNEVRVQYVPVPYNIGFELGIIAKSQDDALQILEQILPYFQPSFSLTLNMIPDMNEKRDVAIVLNNISSEDEWDDSFMQRRYIAYTLNFTAKTYLYGPYSTSDIIRKAIIHETIGDLDVNRRTVTRTYTPKAVTDINSDGVIDVNDDALVDAGDDFGFNEGIEFL